MQKNNGLHIPNAYLGNDMRLHVTIIEVMGN